VVLSIAVFCRCVPPPTSEPAAESTQPLPDALTTLFEPSQKFPKFFDLAGLFDPSISATEYDFLRRLFFDTFIKPGLPKNASYSMAWEYFKSKTDRPDHGNLKGTGISSDAARHLRGSVINKCPILIGQTTHLFGSFRFNRYEPLL
jgi:hypothetical protein